MEEKISMRMCDNDTVKWKHDGKRYALLVKQDEFPLNPRQEFDNLASMICFDRSGIGDEHDYKTPEQFWQDMVHENVTQSEILDAVMAGEISGVRVDHCGTRDGTYDVYEVDCFGKEYLQYSELIDFEIPAFVMDDLSVENCMMLLKPHATWLPLWLYEHSGRTISAGKSNPYTCCWDSSCIGWIFLTKKRAMDELMDYVYDENGDRVREEWVREDGSIGSTYKTVSPTEENWRHTAEQQMRSEVEFFAQYLEGDVYGFELYSAPDDDLEEDLKECDSCFGFYGDDIMENGICDEIGCGLRDAIESGEYESGTAKYEVVTHVIL